MFLNVYPMKLVEDKRALSPSQIGFRSDYSTWHAHKDLEMWIKVSRRQRQIAPLVTLDGAKAYDSVEHKAFLKSTNEP